MKTGQPIREARLTGTRAQARDNVLAAFGYLHCVDTGDRLVLEDGERYMQVDFDLKGRPDGAVDGQGTGKVRFLFFGYSDVEADQLFDQYLNHSGT